MKKQMFRSALMLAVIGFPAIASAEECKSQLSVAGKLGAISRDESIRAIEDYSIVCRMLNRLIVSRKSRGDGLE